MKIEDNVLIDRIVRFKHGEDILCRSQVPKEAPIFKNHFPGSPILPGIVLVEAMAQASGYMHMLSYDFSKMLYLATIKNVKFRKFVYPNQHVEISSRLCRIGDEYIFCKSQIAADDGSILVNGELILSLSDFPNENLRNLIMKNTNMVMTQSD